MTPPLLCTHDLRRSNAVTRKKLSAAAQAANTHRARVAGQQQAAQAREAIAILLASTDRSHQRWIDVLRHRAKHPSASLRELAETMTPPMTKSAYAALLSRALRAADDQKREQQR